MPAPRILVVDDAPDQLLAFKAVLAKLGYDVTTAEGYKDGHHTLRNDHFDLLISNLSLNDQRGQGLLLAEEAKKNVPPPSVVLVGGRQGLKRAAAPLRRCVDEYLVKPVSVKSLLGGVARSLKNKSRRNLHAAPGKPRGRAR